MALAPGTLLGPFEILSQLGAGGMGVVYRAWDGRLAREVAIKVLPPAFAEDGDRLRRFEQEARATGGLNHPNILSVFDIGTFEGCPYIVMELLEGETLRERLGAGALPVRKALEVALAVAQGLTAAHEKAIVHRDLKPENIFITREGRVKILDFGLAKMAPAPQASLDQRTEPLFFAAGPQPTLQVGVLESEVGAIVGTCGYMSPEQVKAAPLDGRSDLFALGVVLWEMVTGRRPFLGESAIDVMHAILRLDPPELDPELRIPPLLEGILQSCLAKDPAGRFHSAHDLAFALRACSGASMTALPGRKRAPRWGRLLRVLAPSLATGALLVLALLLIPGLGRGEVDLAAYRFTPFATGSDAATGAAWSPDGKAVAYLRLQDRAWQVFVRSLDSENARQLTHLPPSPASFFSSVFWSREGDRIFFLSQGSLWSVAKVGGDPEQVQKDVLAADLSPDGRTLAFWKSTEENGKVAAGLWLATPVNAPGRVHATCPLGGDGVTTPILVKFSPDGRRIYLGGYTEKGAALWLLPFPDTAGKPRQIFADVPFVFPPMFSWMPDGRHAVLAFAKAPASVYRLWLADVDKGTMRPVLMGTTNTSSPAVSRDGTSLLYTTGGRDFDVVEIPLDGSPLRPMLGTSLDEWGGAWLPDGEQFVFITDRRGGQELRARNLSTGWERVLAGAGDFPDGSSGLLFAPTVSPDGTRIAYARSAAKGGVFIWISPVSGGSPSRVTSSLSGMEVAPTWSPDGRSIVFEALDGDGNVTLSRVRVGGSQAPTPIHPIHGTARQGIAYPLEWSPAGEWILLVQGADLILVSPDGKGTRTLEGLAGVGHAWSRDGRSIYRVVAGDHPRVDLVQVEGGAVRKVRDLPLGAEMSIRSTTTYGLRLTLSPDGRSLCTTALHQRSDIWMLQDFDRRRRLLGGRYPGGR